MAVPFRSTEKNKARRGRVGIKEDLRKRRL
jgi:hypothetical protein